jgi:hypothetical protein
VKKIAFSRQHGAWEPYIPGLVLLQLRKKYNILGPVGNNIEKTREGREGGKKAIIIPGSGSTHQALCGPRLDHYGRVGEQNHVHIKELYLTILSKEAIQFLSCFLFTVHILPSLQQINCAEHPSQNAPHILLTSNIFQPNWTIIMKINTK